MIQQTSKADAPWILVESFDKFYGRIKILDAVCAKLESVLKNKDMK